jgi:hypothetical protein
MKRLLKGILWIAVILVIISNLPYKYSNDKVIEYVTIHAGKQSKCMCAWYCMRALQYGGCVQCPILPAYAYDKLLPQLGFKQVSRENYKPLKGDISVLPQNQSTVFGHIAIWNGSQWISDYRQKTIYPNSVYREKGEYKIFRNTDGWHWAHIYITPYECYQYIVCLINGIHKIRV